ncbi:MAG TPA: hypothetical protein VMF09_10100 [Solirubrobacteraceae bacterium]|nr:hypothetical protein [Solirubrobacteraceae bacterium]
MQAVSIDELALAEDSDPWTACGFALTDHACQIGAVRVRFTDPGAGPGAAQAARGLVGWSLRGIDSAQLDGLPTTISHSPLPAAAPAHPNGVLAIDHVVAISPAFERSVAALRRAGLELRRVREQPTPAGAPRQAFFRLGREILELVEEPDRVARGAGGPQRPAHFWGLALLAEDLERAAASFAPHVSEIRAAVQPGRRIATVRRSAGFGVPLALISRESASEARREAVEESLASTSGKGRA